MVAVVQYRPSSAYDSAHWTTNSGAPVWNNNASLTVGERGTSVQTFCELLEHVKILYCFQ